MTVAQQTPYSPYTGNGVSTVFPYTFKILDEEDLQVYVNGVLQTLNVNYSVSGVGADGGGSVTFLTGAPGSTLSVSILRAMIAERATDYQTGGDFNSEQVNPDFDRAILLIQDVETQLGRSIRTPADEVATLPTLPSIAARSGKYISFDANGQPIASAGTGNDTALRSDLAATTSGAAGDKLVGIRYDAAGSAALALHDYIEDDGSYNLMGFIPQNLKAAIRNRSGLTDLRAYIITALDAAKAAEVGLMAPRGLYTIDGTLTRTGYVNFFGARGGSTGGRCTTLNVVHATGSLLVATGGEFETFHVSDFDIIGGGGDGSACFLLSRPQAVIERINMDSSIGYNNPGIKFLDNGTLTTSFGSMVRDFKWVGPYTSPAAVVTPTPCNFRGLDLLINGGSLDFINCTAIFGSVGAEVRQGQAIRFVHLQCNRQSAASSTDTATTGQAAVRLSGALSGGGLVNYKENISFTAPYLEACTRHIYVESCEGLNVADGIIQDLGFGTSPAIEFVGANVQNATVSNMKIDMTLAGAIGIKNASPNGVKEWNNHFNLPGAGSKYISTTTRIDYDSASDRVIAGTLDDVNKLAYDTSWTTGTFTPTFKGSTTAGTQTYSLQSGIYRRHGRTIFFDLAITMTAKDGATAGNLQIEGLPFTSKNNASIGRVYCCTIGEDSNIDYTAGKSRLGAEVSNNATTITLMECGDNVAAAALTAAALQATSAIKISGSYEI